MGSLTRRGMLGAALGLIAGSAAEARFPRGGGGGAALPSGQLQPLMQSHFEFSTATTTGTQVATIGPVQVGSTLTVSDARFSVAATALPQIWAVKLASGTISADGSLTFTETNGANSNTSTWGFKAYTPATNTTVSATLGSTDKQYLRAIKAWLDGIPEENDITVTITGPVQLAVYPWRKAENQFGAGTYTLVKRELYPEDAWTSVAILQTLSASVGANVGQMVFTANNGRYESGASTTCTLNLSVSITAPLTWLQGGMNAAGHGGYDLTQLGSATDWTITSQSVSGLFAIWNGASVGGTNDQTWQRVAFAGTYGAAPTVTPSAGTPTVTVHSASLAVTQTLTATVDLLAYTICPRTTLDSSSSDQLISLYGAAHYFGGRGVLDPGTYYGQAGYNLNASITSHPSTPGVVAPTAPYTRRDGWSPDGICTMDPGWFTIYPAKPDSIVWTNPNQGNIYGGRNPAYLRVTGIPQTFYLNASNQQWVMADHAQANADNGYSVNWNSDFTNVFLRDIYTQVTIGPENPNTTGNTTVVGIDCQHVGCWTDGMQDNQDRMSSLIINGVAGRKRAAMSWHFSTNNRSFGAAHMDAWQPAAFGRYHDTGVYPAGTTFDYADVFGIIFALGIPSPDTDNGGDTKLSGGTQNFFIGDSGGTTHRSDAQHRIRFVGNMVYDIAYRGINMIPYVTTGSIINHNGLSCDWGVSASYIAGTGYAAVGISTAGSIMTYNGANFDAAATTGSVIFAGNYSLQQDQHGFLWCNDAAQCTGRDNYSAANDPLTSGTLSFINANFQNPTLGQSAQTVALMQAAMEPKATSATFVTTGSGRPVGPFAPKSVRRIDHRRRRVYPEALTGLAA